MTTRPIALTMGEPAGVGAEIALKAWMRREELSLPPFFLLDDPRRLARLAEKLNWRVDVAEIDVPADTEQAFDQYLPVLPRPLPGSVLPGTPNPANARAVLSAIEDAAGLVQDGAAAALVTNPINKAVLYEAGFSHPGHTEYLARLSDTEGSFPLNSTPAYSRATIPNVGIKARERIRLKPCAKYWLS